jgi:hypothetical protein
VNGINVATPIRTRLSSLGVFTAGLYDQTDSMAVIMTNAHFPVESNKLGIDIRTKQALDIRRCAWKTIARSEIVLRSSHHHSTHLNIKSVAKKAAHMTGFCSLAPTKLQSINPNRNALYWKWIESKIRNPGWRATAKAIVFSSVWFFADLVNL